MMMMMMMMMASTANRTKTDEASTKNVTTKNVVTIKPKRERKMHFVETQTRSSQIESSKVL